MAVNSPCLAVRSSKGINLYHGPPVYEDVPEFTKDESKACRTMVFSPDGKYFGWITDKVIKICLCSNWSVVAVIEKPKVFSLQFSPLGTFLMTWMPFIVSKDNPQGSPQMHFWKSENGENVASFTQKRQVDWEPQWSKDEKICGMLINNNVYFYENANFEKSTCKMTLGNGAKFKISPKKEPYVIACYLPGKQGQPSIAQIVQYPNFDTTQSLARKSFFQSDSVQFLWNTNGTSVLVITSSDVDVTGASYYGKQALHYLNVKGEAVNIILQEHGTIHSVEWSPKGNEFCVIFGSMPTNAKIFNTKCEPIHEFGKGYRNSIYYNPHGNILLLAGFGNLRGTMEIWDVEKKKLIAQTDAPDTTLLEWSPNGEHFVTATTAPRLRTANNYKIWHYTGTLLHKKDWNEPDALYEVLWQRFPENTFPEKPISYKAVEGIVCDKPQASKEVYRPPSQRGRVINFSLHDDDDTTKKPEPSKNASKWKKKREAKKNKRQAEGETVPPKPVDKSKQNNTVVNKGTNDASLSTEEHEKIKRIRRIQSTLKKISKLKESLSAGKKLEINQLDKIKTEGELLKELEALTS
ncbi:eukaryotic translation initiation factor 2A [Chelonus insularis]|uniref:eukaryotic translation initiation factor 2A n=1 Tax=Chelonus insularis TaxID=460826 RepID=UPI0015887720|nr:eukaryotic translation initiation factor 2A [Chelonus insularis]